MDFFRKFFRKSKRQPEDLMQVAQIIGPLVDRTASEIFSEYGTDLLQQEPTYIVPAVWGATMDGDLTTVQRSISQRLAPVIEQVIHAFEFDRMTQAQSFALSYLVRSLFISKILFMIEMMKNQEVKRSEFTDILLSREPIGNA